MCRYLKHFSKKGYIAKDIPTMINSLLSENTFNTLRLVQKTELSRCMKRYMETGYLTKPYKDYLIELYTDKVLLNSVKQQIINKQKIESSHIGIQMLNNL